ncbi:MAG TPA: heterodisulfide reductase-related iron-sulfur binding cluster [Acidobacteriaceae bacterium]|nr:heterodisulfide reductase-related iron-sulfur binding cluster [Acidobacteriaceae bacterium]
MTLHQIEGTSGSGLECPAASAFDAHHPPSPDLISRCVHCGFCLPACPTYVLWGNEMDSPRGRIYLMKMASTGEAQITPDWVEHFDTCLGCMSCLTACPSGVQYDALIESTRGQIERLHKRSLADRLFRKMMFNLFPRIERLRILRRLLFLYQRLGIQTALRKSGILKLLPARLQAMESLMPQLGPYESIPRTTPAIEPQRRRVGLVLGCVQREFLSEVNAATVRVLAAEGCEVFAPQEQPCCGALLVHAGEEQQAEVLARRMIDAFEKANVDVIISNAGGCGSNLKDYHRLLRDDPAYAERAARFSAKCRDITEFLEELGPRAVRHPLAARVAYHDSCHLQHAQRVRSQPRSQLASIPNLELLELAEGAICCGSAGIYNLVRPKTADTLADRKAGHIAAVHPEIVATGNPGCLLQLRTALERSGQKTKVLHTINLLDASIRNAENAPSKGEA